MTNFDQMTNEELNRELAERFHRIMPPHPDMFPNQHTEMIQLQIENKPGYCSTWWNPTHPDSNQIERYVFPKLYCDIQETHDPAGYYEIQILGDDKNEDDFEIRELNSRGHDKNNRTKAIAALKAWEEINE